MAQKEATLRKRQQIDASRKTMFIYVAIAAFVAGAALVIIYFLSQQIIFHTKVIANKQGTISSLDNNINTIEDLKNNVRSLEANRALNSIKNEDEESALQVVLDALPSTANSDALGASLQKKFIDPVKGVSLESLTVNATDASGEDADAAPATGDDVEIDENAIGFTATVSGNANDLKQLMQRFEKSIRHIKISSMEMQSDDGGRLSMVIIGQAHFQPAKEINLQKKVVKP